MNLHFTLTEKINFLKSRGYTIVEATEEVEEHIHGSRFHAYRAVTYYAIKKGAKYGLQRIFTHELKKKLLTE